MASRSESTQEEIAKSLAVIEQHLRRLRDLRDTGKTSRWTKTAFTPVVWMAVSSVVLWAAGADIVTAMRWSFIPMLALWMALNATAFLGWWMIMEMDKHVETLAKALGVTLTD